MHKEELAKYIAEGIIVTGVEGTYNDVSCSSAGDYPSLGISQWEGERADTLLLQLDDGGYYRNRSYSDLKSTGDIVNLKNLLATEQGRKIQEEQLQKDACNYVDMLLLIPLKNTASIVYAGLWCPTSTWVVQAFLTNRNKSYDLNDVEVLSDVFKRFYARAAGVSAYALLFTYLLEYVVRWIRINQHIFHPYFLM